MHAMGYEKPTIIVHCVSCQMLSKISKVFMFKIVNGEFCTSIVNIYTSHKYSHSCINSWVNL